MTGIAPPDNHGGRAAVRLPVRRLIVVLLAGAGLGCGSPVEETLPAGSVTSTGFIPLMDLKGSRFGIAGGLYGSGTNIEPRVHADSARAAARRVRPLSGRYAVLSIGFSNLAHEFCCKATTTLDPPYTPQSFMGQASADPTVRRDPQVLVNGAMGGQTNSSWDQPGDPDYNIVRSRLAKRGLTEAQVRVVILKIANTVPKIGLPSLSADAYALMRSTGSIIRALKTRYPNLQMVFLMARSYGGYATTVLNPEPYAYEGGFAVQRVVKAQIKQYTTGVIDPVVGNVGMVWVGWGPYLWADGIKPRSDGLRWLKSDFMADGVHPSTVGIGKTGLRLLNFFKATSYTSCWFLANRTC